MDNATTVLLAPGQWALFEAGDALGWTSSPYFEAAYSLLNNEKFLSSVMIIYGGIRTPTTFPKSFDPVKGTPGKMDPKTGEIFVRDKFHKNHYEVYKNRRDFENGKRSKSVWDDGRLKEIFE